jgi:hypothetical protein
MTSPGCSALQNMEGVACGPEHRIVELTDINCGDGAVMNWPPVTQLRDEMLKTTPGAAESQDSKDYVGQA